MSRIIVLITLLVYCGHARVLLMGQFNFPTHEFYIEQWHASWKGIFEHIVVFAPIKPPQVKSLMRKNITVYTFQRHVPGESPRLLLTPLHNIAKALSMFSDDYDAILYMHDDFLLNMDYIDHFPRHHAWRSGWMTTGGPNVKSKKAILQQQNAIHDPSCPTTTPIKWIYGQSDFAYLPTYHSSKMLAMMTWLIKHKIHAEIAFPTTIQHVFGHNISNIPLCTLFGKKKQHWTVHDLLRHCKKEQPRIASIHPIKIEYHLHNRSTQWSCLFDALVKHDDLRWKNCPDMKVRDHSPRG